jgi:deoxyribodipyrimidine photo-lyase
MGVVLFWHRRDLRIEDNAGLYHALKSGHSVQPVFIFDSNILSRLSSSNDARVTFIHTHLARLNDLYQQFGGSLHVYHGDPVELIPGLVASYHADAVYTNRDYEPYARDRDTKIHESLKSSGIALKAFKDHVIFDRNEVMKPDDKPYTVFTPYSKRWKEKLNDFYLRSYPTNDYLTAIAQTAPTAIPSLDEIGFEHWTGVFPSGEPNDQIIGSYDQTRNFPALHQGVSHLGVHLRFGTISVRQLARKALQLNQTFLNELIWREFFQMILYQYPQTVNQAFKPVYDRVEWRNDPEEFNAWCQGQTGYPMVDAGMRELNATGYMHNRSRMITASFLTKHLLIDWRWGERYFAEKLLDFDLASNVGGWQWAAGSGCDAAPYFRVFNPQLQMDKFDAEQKYVRKWVPEYGSPRYPQPIVSHTEARERVLQAYREALNEQPLRS